MKCKYAVTVALLIFLLSCPGFSQVQLSGFTQTSAYALGGDNDSQYWNFYQDLQLRLAPVKNPHFYFNSFLRFARFDAPSEWQERIYNTYVHWNNASRSLQFRLGRQFTYYGVINGTFDGLQVALKPIDKLTLRVVAGLEAPFDRSLELQDWDKGNVLGGFASYRMSDLIKMDLSIYQKSREGEAVWRQLGTALSGRFLGDFHYLGQFDFNLLAESYQSLRFRLTYLKPRWSLSGEVNSHKPRLFEDSYFNLFELEAYNQLRTAFAYQLGNYRLGLHYLLTFYGDGESNNQGVLSVSNAWGSAGVTLTDGFAGNNTGVFGEIRYDLMPELTVRLYSSYYQYQRYTVQINEEAVAYSAGATYRFSSALRLSAELQQSINSYYSNDMRGLLRLFYGFGI